MIENPSDIEELVSGILLVVNRSTQSPGGFTWAAFFSQTGATLVGAFAGFGFALLLQRVVDIRRERKERKEAEVAISQDLLDQCRRRKSLLVAILASLSRNDKIIREVKSLLEEWKIPEVNIDLVVLDATSSVKYEILSEDHDFNITLDVLRYSMATLDRKLSTLASARGYLTTTMMRSAGWGQIFQGSIGTCSFLSPEIDKKIAALKEKIAAEVRQEGELKIRLGEVPE